MRSHPEPSFSFWGEKTPTKYQYNNRKFIKGYKILHREKEIFLK